MLIYDNILLFMLFSRKICNKIEDLFKLKIRKMLIFIINYSNNVINMLIYAKLL